MASFLHLLTAAAIFVHATLGCCAHESHEVGSAVGNPSDCRSCELHSSPQASPQASPQDDHDHADLSQELQRLSQESQQPASHQCSHADCKWLQTNVDLLTLDFAGFLPSTVTALLAFSLNNGSLGDGFNFSHLLPDASMSMLPVRLHLAHCVLLI